MLNILVVDDRLENRKDVKELLELAVPEGASISVEAIPPFEQIDEYAKYIGEHDIAALLLDERLNETAISPTQGIAGYFGHEVIAYVRAAFPDFPVYVVTTYKGDDSLVEQASQFEEIFDRSDFQKNIETYALRIWRASTRYQDSMQDQLKLMGELAMKAAEGNLTEPDQQKLTSTRALLGMPFLDKSPLLFSDFITQAQSISDDAIRLIEKIKSDQDKK
jgi:CheY-like chemotaxis protein